MAKPTNYLSKLIPWILTEIILNCAGLDGLANYSEFVFSRHSLMDGQIQLIFVATAPMHHESINVTALPLIQPS